LTSSRTPASARTWRSTKGSLVSGGPGAIDAMAAGLEARGLAARRLHTSHAFHSCTADRILAPFTAAVRRVRLAPPVIPLVANLTGTWMRPEEATDPAYWARQLRGTVRFADGLAQLLAEPQRILLEAGPGDTLASFAREHPARRPGQAVIASLRHPKSAEEDAAVLLRAVARLWLAGGDFDWEAFSAGEERRRVSLPTYPFERRRYWIDPLPQRKRSGPPDPPDWSVAGETMEVVAQGPERAAPPGAGHPRPELANPFVAPEAELEQQIAAVLQEILGVDRVGRHDNFFELGGNSLAGVRVINRLKERLQVDVSEVSFYEAPTVAAMARLIGAERQDDPAAAPAFASSRSRGERRKARQVQKVHTGEDV
jgi:phthiocerol/phenolphthiocerol synthesis type-I polyketide synthase E